MLAPSVERAPGPAHAFGIAARDRYPSYIEFLAERTGVKVPLNRLGILQVAFNEKGIKGLRKSALPTARWLDAKELQHFEQFTRFNKFSSFPQFRDFLLFRKFGVLSVIQLRKFLLVQFTKLSASAGATARPMNIAAAVAALAMNFTILASSLGIAPATG